MSLFFFSSNIYANTGSIRGRITEEKTNEPAIGVNVIVKGTYKGAASDIDGNYSIIGLAEGDYDIEVSSIGYKIKL